jgi:hypothetical protein
MTAKRRCVLLEVSATLWIKWFRIRITAGKDGTPLTYFELHKRLWKGRSKSAFCEAIASVTLGVENDSAKSVWPNSI